MHAPTPHQLAVLRPFERFAFRVADFVNRHLKPLSIAWNSTAMAAFLWLGISRRCRVLGLEHVRELGPDARVLLVANHRSFFDFFLIASLVFSQTRLPRRTFFPVRSEFFYTNPLGLLVVGLMGGWAMFPPVARDRRQLRFNNYSLSRVIGELGVPGTVVGIHPEGARGKGPDPHAIGTPKTGAGVIALGAEHAVVIPVFGIGLGNSIIEEIANNWFRPDDREILVAFGPPIPLDDLRTDGAHLTEKRKAAERCIAAIQALADEHRRK